MALVAAHPAVDGVELAGSRSHGTHEELSDWDFAVATSDFDAAAGLQRVEKLGCNAAIFLTEQINSRRLSRSG